MNALVLTGPNAFEIRSVPTPVPARLDVLCKVDSVYICGTDPHIIKGDYPGFWPKAYPFIPGHEWSGTIVRVGPDAGGFGFEVGDRVAGTSHCGCGQCRMCASGRYNLCENYGHESLGHRQYGHYTNGSYADYVVHSIRSVFRVPASLSLEEAALMDPASIALHTVKRGSLRPGDTIAIVGPGPMGLMVLLCARALGASRVIVVGRGVRLQSAVALGAIPVDYTQGDPIAQVRELTDGHGADVVVECAGTPIAMSQAMDMVRKGGCVSVIGISLEPAILPMRKIVLDEIDVHGVRANRGTCEEVLPLLATRQIDVRPLLTHEFRLAQFATALLTYNERRDGALKVRIKPGNE
jgi:L-iditol 2-dehydrogenase